jgi:hypothetical protein
VPPLVGCVPPDDAEPGAAAPAEGAGGPATDAPLDGEALAAGPPAEDVPFPAAVCPAEDCVEAEVVAP